MGRPPCCDKVAVKKGPWTPEEDIILVSYIQEHGPGNWRSVSKNAGLLRCSKSCRLRWTNYLRPGIRRGNFTPHEEGMIIHLQSLLGNRWAAIASYLPQRTDNDIKNYWNTHLKKRIKKFQSALDSHSIFNSCISQLHSKGCSGTRSSSLRSCTTYALSTENISRLLEGWMKPTPKDSTSDYDQQSNGNTNVEVAASSHSVDPKLKDERCDLITHDELENLLSFDNLNNIAWETSSADFTTPGYLSSGLSDGPSSMAETKERSFLGKWLFDEATAHVDDLIDLHVDCSSASIF